MSLLNIQKHEWFRNISTKTMEQITSLGKVVKDFLSIELRKHPGLTGIFKLVSFDQNRGFDLFTLLNHIDIIGSCIQFFIDSPFKFPRQGISLFFNFINKFPGRIKNGKFQWRYFLYLVLKPENIMDRVGQYT